MEQRLGIYIDVLFVENVIIDYMLLLAAAKICANYFSRLRAALAAVAGGAYAVMTLVFPGAVTSSPVTKLAVSFLIVFTAFFTYRDRRRLPRIYIVFLAVSALCGGLVYAVALLGGRQMFIGGGSIYFDLSFPFLIAVCLAAYAVTALIMRRTAAVERQGAVQVTARLGDREISFEAFVDTGNSLRDGATNASIVVAELSVVRQLVPPDAAGVLERQALTDAPRLVHDLSLVCENVFFRLVPYKTVGSEFGLIAAVRPDQLVIDGRRQRGGLIAISPSSLDDGCGRRAIVGVQ